MARAGRGCLREGREIRGKRGRSMRSHLWAENFPFHRESPKRRRSPRAITRGAVPLFHARQGRQIYLNFGSAWRLRARPAQGSPASFDSRCAMFTTVYWCALFSDDSSLHLSGTETGAPARARVE